MNTTNSPHQYTCYECSDLVPDDEVTEMHHGRFVCLECYDESEDVL